MFSIAPHAVDVTTHAGTYQACHTAANPTTPLSKTLSEALQRRLGDNEALTAAAARSALAGHGLNDDTDLLVVDGPLRGRQHLPRSVGFIKTHRTSYRPPQLHAMVATLTAGQRTPVFLMGTSWDRHSWYLRLPCPPGAPWAGIVRIECSADLKPSQVIALANLSQVTMPRFASTEYTDPRAPQNLYPIAGLERQLRPASATHDCCTERCGSQRPSGNRSSTALHCDPVAQDSKRLSCTANTADPILVERWSHDGTGLAVQV